MRSKASACGSATIINAIATGRGAAFAINLRVHAEVNLLEGKKKISGQVGETSESSKLIETCVGKVLEDQGLRSQYGANVRTSVGVPIAVGLSSSSAAANATVLAAYNALGKNPEPEKIINLGVDASFAAGTTVTGAFDDASASFLGGGVATDNKKREILDRFEIDPDLKVLIFIPPQKSYTADFDVERVKCIEELVEFVYEEALAGNIYGAQTINGLLYCSVLEYDPKPALEALRAGALSAGLTGTGPAFVAISEKNIVEEIEEVWKELDGSIIVTEPSIKGARIEK
ncbi:hypothetical protein AKJ43_02240 [candidate division MSBL1 archaeon SCGC-AAA261D19]|uniref:Shikimate kinase n=1 Tax=candidate division MSBL1 archaeon SCGC-AAA261D19 TaxID=1698273 RepID=A0A133V6V2_9EURY|nr:hypothetical protein AKJ43_02240 [candidate division MSBL1 archaeon SCGC-AAA261D19]